MPFDLASARRDGYSDYEIAGFLAADTKDFDVATAIGDGHSLDEVVSFLNGGGEVEQAPAVAPVVPDPVFQPEPAPFISGAPMYAAAMPAQNTPEAAASRAPVSAFAKTAYSSLLSTPYNAAKALERLADVPISNSPSIGAPSYAGIPFEPLPADTPGPTAVESAPISGQLKPMVDLLQLNPDEQKVLSESGLAGDVLLAAGDMVGQLPYFMMAGQGGGAAAKRFLSRFTTAQIENALPTVVKVLGPKAIPFVQETLGMAAGFGALGAVQEGARVTAEGGTPQEIALETLKAIGGGVATAPFFTAGSTIGVALAKNLEGKFLQSAARGAGGGAGFASSAAATGGDPHEILVSGLLGFGMGFTHGTMPKSELAAEAYRKEPTIRNRALLDKAVSEEMETTLPEPKPVEAVDTQPTTPPPKPAEPTPQELPKADVPGVQTVSAAQPEVAQTALPENRGDRIKRILKDIPDENNRAELERAVLDEHLGDYGVTNFADADAVVKEFEASGRTFAYERDDGSNLNGANAQFGHAGANDFIKKIWGEVFTKRVQENGGIVFRGKGDEFKVIWPDKTAEEANAIRSEIDSEIESKVDELGLRDIPNPKMNGMQTGAFSLDYGIVDHTKGKYGEVDRDADAIVEEKKKEKYNAIAESKGYTYNKEKRQYEYRSVPSETRTTPGLNPATDNRIRSESSGEVVAGKPLLESGAKEPAEPETPEPPATTDLLSGDVKPPTASEALRAGDEYESRRRALTDEGDAVEFSTDIRKKALDNLGNKTTDGANKIWSYLTGSRTRDANGNLITPDARTEQFLQREADALNSADAENPELIPDSIRSIKGSSGEWQPDHIVDIIRSGKSATDFESWQKDHAAAVAANDKAYSDELAKIAEEGARAQGTTPEEIASQDATADFASKNLSENESGTPLPPTKPPVTVDLSGDAGDRAHAKKLDAAGRPMSSGSRKYQVVHDKEAIDAAHKILDEKGIDGAESWVLDTELPSKIHVATAEVLMERLQEKANSVRNSNPEEANGIIERAMRISDRVLERSTNIAQALQAHALILKLDPANIIHYANRMIAKDKSKGKRGKKRKLTNDEAKKLIDVADKVKKLDILKQESDDISALINEKLTGPNVAPMESGGQVEVDLGARKKSSELPAGTEPINPMESGGQESFFTPEELQKISEFAQKLQDKLGAQSKPGDTPRQKAAVEKKSFTKVLSDRLSAAEDAARNRFNERNKGARLNAGLPIDDMLDLSIIGASKIAKTGLKFADWSTKMSAEFGDWIKPHLVDVWKKSQEVFSSENRRARQSYNNARDMLALIKKLDVDPTTSGTAVANKVASMVKDLGTISEADRPAKIIKIAEEVMRDPIVKESESNSDLMKIVDKVRSQNGKVEDRQFGEFVKLVNRYVEKNKGETSDDLAKEIGNLIDQTRKLTGEDKVAASQDLQIALSNLSKPGVGRYLSTILNLSWLLNSKTTLVRNPIGNEILYRVKRASKYVATPIDIAHSKLTGKDRTVTFKTGIDDKFWTGFFKGAQAGWKGVEPEELPSKFDIKGHTFRGKYNPMTYFEKTLGAALTSFDFAAYTRGKNNALGEMAQLAAINRKIPRAQRSEFVKKFVENIDEASANIAMEQGLEYSLQKNTHLARTLGATKKALNFDKEFGLGNFLLNYTKVPANIIEQAINFSPIGITRDMITLLSPFAKSEKPTTRQIITSLSESLVGTGISALGLTLYNAGVLTGSKDKDKDLRQFKSEQTGERNYSVNVSALGRFGAGAIQGNTSQRLLQKREGDTFVSWDWAQPFSIPLAVGANVGKGGSAGAVAGAVASGTETFFEQPVMTGVQKMFDTKYGATMSERLLKISEDIPASMIVPSAANQVRQIADNTARETQAPTWFGRALNKIVSRTPMLSKTLPAQSKTLGSSNREVYQNSSNTLFNVLINPGFINKYQVDPLIKTILEPYDREGRTGQFPRIAPKKLQLSSDALYEHDIEYDGDISLDLPGEKLQELQRLMAQKTMENFSTWDPQELQDMSPQDQEAELAKDVSAAVEDAKWDFIENNKRYIVNHIRSQKGE
jgi:GGDEF domain-containing protein